MQYKEFMNFQTYLKQSSEKVQQQVSHIINQWREESNQIAPQLEDLTQLFTTSMTGGKCLRGSLIMIGSSLHNENRTKDVTTIAAAYEILCTALLIHDDVIDRSPTRRGKPTLHTALGNSHYGFSQAICLGDIGIFLATRLIADSPFDSKLKTTCLSIVSQLAMHTFIGEMLDIKLSLPDEEKLEKDVIDIHKLKASYYTIVCPLLIGATLCNAPQKTTRFIQTFGTCIGIAFQIQDDILGVFGEEKAIGKSATSDIEENKNTLLITYALQNATTVQKKMLEQHYGKGVLTDKQLQEVKQVFIDTGSLAYSQLKAKQYIEKGKKIIPKLTADPIMQKLLSDFADFIIDRRK